MQRLSPVARAIALDMESATIAANGFRFRVPYGTLLCVSDKPLHGELKLPGMATEFYKQRRSAQHLKIGIARMEKLREMPDRDGCIRASCAVSRRRRSSKSKASGPRSSMGRNSCHMKLE